MLLLITSPGDGQTTVTCSRTSGLQNKLKKTAIAYELSSHRYPITAAENGLHRIAELWEEVSCSDSVLGNV